jgi:hypothetical protein
VPTDKLPDNLLKWPVELLRIVDREEAERLSSLSWDSIKRNHADKIVEVSARRRGMRIGDCLMLATQQKQRETNAA